MEILYGLIQNTGVLPVTARFIKEIFSQVDVQRQTHKKLFRPLGNVGLKKN
jgi:hypothetical protein